MHTITGIVIPNFIFTKFHILAGYFEDNPFKDVINIVLTISRWCIWKRRNIKKFENESMTHQELFQWVKEEIKKHLHLLENEKTKIHGYQTLLQNMN